MEDPTGTSKGEQKAAGQLAVLLVLGGVATAALVAVLWPFLPALVTATVLAVILAPAHRGIRSRVRGRRLAAVISTVLGVAGLVAPLFAVGAVALREASSVAEWFMQGGPSELRMPVEMEAAIDMIALRFGVEGFETGRAVAARLQTVPDFLASRALGFLAGVGGLAAQGGVMVFTLYFIFRDIDRIDGLLRRLIPLGSRQTTTLLDRAHEVVAAAVYGNLLVAVVQGTLGGTAFLVLGLPTPVMWGAVMGAASLIPMVGPGLIWLPTSVILLVSGSVARGVVLLVFGLLVISTIDNVIRALFVSSRARIHPLAIFLGVLGGILLFGVVGVFVGPVLLVVSLLLVEMVRSALFPGEDGSTGGT